MFGKPNIYAMLNGFKVRVKDAREKDRNHLIEIDLEVPLTYALADDIMPQMAADLFESVGGEWQAKPEIEEASFNLSPELQIVEMREHPELDPLVRIAGVTLRKITAYKGEGNSLLLGFTATWTLGDTKREAVTMIERLKTGLYLTCEPQQRTLADTNQTEAPAAQGTTFDVKDGGVVNIRRGRRRKEKPEPPQADVASGADADGVH